MTATKAPDDVLRRIRQGNRFLLTSHVNPDGDSIGSALGLARLLRRMGKGAVVWNRDETPPVYQVLPGADRIHSSAEPPAGYPEKFDAIVVLECPSADRTGLEEHLDELPVINIDHHLGNQHYGAINWVDPSAPAVGEMVYRLAQTLKLTLDNDTANCLYLTLVTDTGGFRYSNATAGAFEAAASLVRAGAQPDLVARWLYESRTEASLRLLAELLGTMELHAGGKVATARITQAMYQRTGATPGDAEGLINYPRSVAGVSAVAVARELPEGGAKVSLRSRGEVDVEQVARRHGGGGHRNAAGYQVDGSVEEALAAAAAALAEVVAAPAPAAEPAAGAGGGETAAGETTGGETAAGEPAAGDTPPVR